jgi:hypothetical protein
MGGTPDNDKIQTEGREANAAQPLNEADGNAGAERYPPVRSDDAVDAAEERSFDRGNPEPRQGAGDGSAPASANDGRLGPGGDPVEGKR